jgi:hypothetical protein
LDATPRMVIIGVVLCVIKRPKTFLLKSDSIF